MRLSVALLFLILLLPSCLTGQTDELDFIEKEIRRTMRKQHLPAMAVTVVEGSEISYQEAFGMIDVDRQIPATTRSVFKLWSLAKAFTAIEIFREVEEGLVDLDAPLTDYLPGFSIRSRFSGNAVPTVKEVLAHRAGLPRHEGLMPAGIARDLNYLERFELGASNCDAAYAIGTRYKYSNLGYDLLGRVIEECRKEGFFRHMKLELLNDLGMQNADFYSGALDPTLQVALGYSHHKRKYLPLKQYDINNFPSGNLYATIEDLSAFLQALFRGEVYRHEQTLARQLIDRYSRADDPETMGLGWKLAPLANGDTLVWHDGGPSEGIGSLVAFLPDQQIGLAVIGNGSSFSGFYALQLALKILDGITEESLDDQAAAVNKGSSEPAENLPAGRLEQVQGSYAAFGSMAEVSRKGKKLKISLGGFTLDLLPLKDGRFAVSHWMERWALTRIIKPPVNLSGLSLSFRDEDGEVPGTMILNLMDFSHEICPRYPVKELDPEFVKQLCGSYGRGDLIPGGTRGAPGEAVTEIGIEKGVLTMSPPYGPLLPLNDTLIRVLSGPFHGEVLDLDPATGVILHQKWAFVPRNHVE